VGVARPCTAEVDVVDNSVGQQWSTLPLLILAQEPVGLLNVTQKNYSEAFFWYNGRLMLEAVSEAQRDVITVVVFIVTFFVALGIGRFLKRRAGVQLGLLFRLFCLTLAFYAAIAVYGVHAPWRYHVGAAAILLSTALIVALVNRYVWDLYFEKKRQTAIPHFLREVVGGVIFLIVLLLILSYGYHAETQLKGLLAGIRGGRNHCRLCRTESLSPESLAEYRSKSIGPIRSVTG
jgi:hypothetical protein